MALLAARFKGNVQLQGAAKNSPALRAGVRGDGVGAIQVALRDLGAAMPISFKLAFPDGIYGAETAAAVKSFQTSKKLTADGVVGRDTMAALDAQFQQEKKGASPPFPQPDPSRILFLSPPGPITPSDVAPLPLAQTGPTNNRPFRPRVKLASFDNASSSAAATPTSAPANGLVTAPPVTAPILIGKRVKNNCGDSSLDDFKSNDRPNPKIGLAQAVSLTFLRTQSPLILETMWRSTFAAVYSTGALGQSMITRFMLGTGLKFDHPVGSELSGVAKSTVTFIASNIAVKAEIEKQFAAQFAASGDVDVSKLSVTVNIPFSTFSTDVTIPPKFRAMIGGIHGIELFATKFALTGIGSYTMTLLYRICDNFGVGNDDLYTPDLQAMWILQHETAGTKPFVNSIEIEESIAGTFATAF